MKKSFQSYRGSWAWLLQRLSAIFLFLLIPLKIYSGWGAKGKVPYFLPGSSKALHYNSTIDILLLLFFLLHAFYGLRVILIDLGWIKEDAWFWRTMSLAMAIFSFVTWYVYIHEY